MSEEETEPRFPPSYIAELKSERDHRKAQVDSVQRELETIQQQHADHKSGLSKEIQKLQDDCAASEQLLETRSRELAEIRLKSAICDEAFKAGCDDPEAVLEKLTPDAIPDDPAALRRLVLDTIEANHLAEPVEPPPSPGDSGFHRPITRKPTPDEMFARVLKKGLNR